MLLEGKENATDLMPRSYNNNTSNCDYYKQVTNSQIKKKLIMNLGVVTVEIVSVKIIS